MKNDAISKVTEELLKVLDKSGLEVADKKKAIWRTETAVIKEAGSSETKPKKAKGSKKAKKKK